MNEGIIECNRVSIVGTPHICRFSYFRNASCWFR